MASAPCLFIGAKKLAGRPPPSLGDPDLVTLDLDVGAVGDVAALGIDLSVAISPTSRLYHRGFSEEVMQCGVSSHVVLQCGGAVLGNGNEVFIGEELQDGEKWHMFVSHNWSVKRWKKFLALCLVWSGKKAIVCCLFVQVLCFILVSLNLVPVSTSGVDGHEVSVWCTAGCLITYLVVFLVIHDVLGFLRVPGYRTFLDKVCVDQEDEGRKRQGIQAITAFLYHSETLVVLYSEVYLRRLWTVFELTTFLALKPKANLLVQPVILGPVTFFLVVVQSLRILEVFLVPSAWEGLSSLDPSLCAAAGVVVALDLLGILACTVLLRTWGCIRANMESQIQQFSFAGAECHVEADRIEIMGAIKALARQEGLVPADASTKQCTQSFEILVKEKVLERMQGAFLLTGIPCRIALLMVLPSMAMVLDVSAIRIRRMRAEDSLKGDVAWHMLAEILQDANYELCMPIAIGLVGILSNSKKGSAFFEAGSIFLCFLLLVLGVWLPGGPLLPSLQTLTVVEPDILCLLLVSILLCQISITWGLYRAPCCRQSSDAAA